MLGFARFCTPRPDKKSTPKSMRIVFAALRPNLARVLLKKLEAYLTPERLFESKSVA